MLLVICCLSAKCGGHRGGKAEQIGAVNHINHTGFLAKPAHQAVHPPSCCVPATRALSSLPLASSTQQTVCPFIHTLIGKGIHDARNTQRPNKRPRELPGRSCQRRRLVCSAAGSAATFTASTTADAAPGGLREAIEKANASRNPTSNIVFDQSLKGATITLAILVRLILVEGDGQFYRLLDYGNHHSPHLNTRTGRPPNRSLPAALRHSLHSPSYYVRAR
jgi:hypothetical protein